MPEPLAEHPFLAGLPESQVQRLAPNAHRTVHHTGARLFRQGDPADRFWLVRTGRVSVELSVPGRGDIVIDQVGPGTVVGWSWLLPPYRWQFGAVAAELSHCIEVDAVAVRRLCAEDPALGYDLTLRFVAVLGERLRAARTRLVDLYGYPAVDAAMTAGWRPLGTVDASSTVLSGLTDADT